VLSWEVIDVKYRMPPFADSPIFFQMLWHMSDDYLHLLFVARKLIRELEISFSLNIHITVWDFFPDPIKCSGRVCTVAVLLTFPLCNYIVLKAISPNVLCY